MVSGIKSGNNETEILEQGKESNMAESEAIKQASIQAAIEAIKTADGHDRNQRKRGPVTGTGHALMGGSMKARSGGPSLRHPVSIGLLRTW